MVAPSITPSAASGTMVCQLPGRGSPWKTRTMRPRGASRSVAAKCAARLSAERPERGEPDRHHHAQQPRIGEGADPVAALLIGARRGRHHQLVGRVGPAQGHHDVGAAREAPDHAIGGLRVAQLMVENVMAAAVPLLGLGGQRRAHIVEGVAIREPGHGGPAAALEAIEQVDPAADVADAQHLRIPAVLRRQIGDLGGEAVRVEAPTG